MKDEVTPRDIERFVDKLWSSVGIPDRYLSGATNADILERILKRRKRLRNLKDIYFNGKARD